ncbi:MAG: phage minor head protein [Angelakisella sp.]
MDSELTEIITGKPMDYDEVLRYFGEKLELTPKEYGQLADQYKTFAFTVGGYNNLQVVKAFHAKLTEAIANGTTLREFRQEMNELLTAKGYEPTDPWAMENVFRTNLQTAYSVGAYQEMTSPAVRRNRPYWQYDAVNDDRTRPAHEALDGKVYPADDPIWDTIYPPNGFRCRCSVSTLSQRELEQQGLTVETQPPGIVPDTGFATNPAKIQFQPDLEGFPPSLVAAYEHRARGGA